MMKNRKRPSVWLGAAVGALLTPALMALMFAADQIASLPFIPFDVFDFVSQRLPGSLLTFGIDIMVDIIIAFNLGETSAAAKTAEQLMGLGAFWALGIVLAALLYALLNRRQTASRNAYPGIALGLVFGAAMMLISGQINQTATAPFALQTAWILLIFAGWGLAANLIYSRLAHAEAEAAGHEKDGETAAVTVLNRRQFMVRVGGASAVMTVAGAGLGAWLGRRPDESPPPVESSTEAAPADVLPNIDSSLQPAPGTRPEYTPLDDHYRIDISSRPPVIDSIEWRLDVTGLVDNPVSLSLEDLRTQFERVDRFVTLSCISNRIGGSLISTTKWSGFRMSDFLDLVQPQANAVALKITGADGFDEYVMMDVIEADERIMFAYEWDDQPLKRKHGFPLRIYIPDRYGMKQPKWIESIEFVDAWQEGYWVRRGWSVEAMVNTVSVVDVAAVGSTYQNGSEYIVPIGGIAYAGAKQISRVDVSVDDGDWRPAQLRQPLSELTWVIWRYDWRFAEGDHKFAVRAYDGDGNLQSLETRGTRPDGATGVHSRRASVPSLDDLEIDAAQDES